MTVRTELAQHIRDLDADRGSPMPPGFLSAHLATFLGHRSLITDEAAVDDFAYRWLGHRRQPGDAQPLADAIADHFNLSH